MKQLTIVCFLFFTFLAFSSAGISREGLVQSEDNFEDLEKDVNSEAEMGKGHVRVKRDRPQDLPCLNLNQRCNNPSSSFPPLPALPLFCGAAPPATDPPQGNAPICKCCETSYSRVLCVSVGSLDEACPPAEDLGFYQPLYP